MKMGILPLQWSPGYNLCLLNIIVTVVFHCIIGFFHANRMKVAQKIVIGRTSEIHKPLWSFVLKEVGWQILHFVKVHVSCVVYFLDQDLLSIICSLVHYWRNWREQTVRQRRDLRARFFMGMCFSHFAFLTLYFFLYLTATMNTPSLTLFPLLYIVALIWLVRMWCSIKLGRCG